METIEAKVSELYELRALLLGFQQEGKVIYPGFIHEKGITEGTKRIANKAAKIIGGELDDISKRRRELEADESLIKEDKEKKDKEILDDTVKFSAELLEFAKVENLSLSMNYEFLYEKLFK